MFYEQKVSHPFDHGSPELALVADRTSRIMIGLIIKTMAPSNICYQLFYSFNNHKRLRYELIQRIMLIHMPRDFSL